MKVKVEGSIRKASQELLPSNTHQFVQKSLDYNIYPFHQLGDGKIFSGYAALSEWIITQKTVLIDGYSGILWDLVKSSLDKEFEKMNIQVRWVQSVTYLKTENALNELIDPFLGTVDAVWGTKTSLVLEDLFQIEDFKKVKPDPAAEINIVIGTGAALLDWQASLIYFDLPKNEVQYRMHAGSITNLGKTKPEESAQMYKRFYFVDWVLLNEHKKNIIDRITVIVDGQNLDIVNWAMFAELRKGLRKLSKSVFRALPWFSAGAWGGSG